jgi:hypothetical protein
MRCVSVSNAITIGPSQKRIPPGRPGRYKEAATSPAGRTKLPVYPVDLLRG